MQDENTKIDYIFFFYYEDQCFHTDNEKDINTKIDILFALLRRKRRRLIFNFFVDKEATVITKNED